MIIGRIIRLFYIGINLAKLHITSYIASLINGVLWFILIFIPTIFLTGRVESLFLLLPGVFALTISSSGMWTATEFLRWYVDQGLTDMFRENGLNILHYMVSGVFIDILFSFLGYILTTIVAIYYLSIDILLIIPHQPIYMLISMLYSASVYLFYGALIGYIYTVTRISGVWTNIIQIMIAIGTIIPPNVFPNSWISIANPASIASELLRASYGYNTLRIELLLAITPITFILNIIISYIICRLSDRYIARYGIEYRT